MMYNLKLELKERRSYGGQIADLFHPICIQVAIYKHCYLEKFCGSCGLGTDLLFTTLVDLGLAFSIYELARRRLHRDIVANVRSIWAKFDVQIYI